MPATVLLRTRPMLANCQRSNQAALHSAASTTPQNIRQASCRLGWKFCDECPARSCYCDILDWTIPACKAACVASLRPEVSNPTASCLPAKEITNRYWSLLHRSTWHSTLTRMGGGY